jgi:hypothetical protein
VFFFRDTKDEEVEEDEASIPPPIPLLLHQLPLTIAATKQALAPSKALANPSERSPARRQRPRRQCYSDIAAVPPPPSSSSSMHVFCSKFCLFLFRLKYFFQFVVIIFVF